MSRRHGTARENSSDARSLQSRDVLDREHLLLGLLNQDDPAVREPGTEGITLDIVRKDLIRVVGARDGPTTCVCQYTADAKRVMEAAEREAALENSDTIEPIHLLHSLLAESEGVHITILRRVRDRSR